MHKKQFKTVGAAFGAKKIVSNGIPITLGIWVNIRNKKEN